MSCSFVREEEDFSVTSGTGLVSSRACVLGEFSSPEDAISKIAQRVKFFFSRVG